MLAIHAGILKAASWLDPKDMQDSLRIQKGTDVGWGEAAAKSVGSLGMWNVYRSHKKDRAKEWQRENNMSMSNDPNDPMTYVQQPNLAEQARLQPWAVSR